QPDLHRAEDFGRRGGGADFPAALAVDRGDRAAPQGSGAACQAVFPASPRRQSGTDPREARRRGPRNGGEAGGVRGPRPTLEREIDRLNIRRASILAMARALARLASTPDLVLVDGLPCPELGRAHEAIVDGDACCHSIAAASVIAKTVRDRLMELLAIRHPSYAWASNKGYGTPDHLAALAAFGFTSHHRKSFAPVVQLELMASPASIPS